MWPSFCLIKYSLFMYSAQSFFCSINVGHIWTFDGLSHSTLVVFFMANSFGFSVNAFICCLWGSLSWANFVGICYTSLLIVHIITALPSADSCRSWTCLLFISKSNGRFTVLKRVISAYFIFGTLDSFSRGCGSPWCLAYNLFGKFVIYRVLVDLSNNSVCCLVTEVAF